MTGTCRDGFFVIVKGDTSVKVVSVKEESEYQPEGYKLFDPYPNPFNPITSIQYAIDSRQFVTITVYDLLGRELVVLLNEEKDAGKYEIQFNSANYNLSSGTYIIVFNASGTFLSRKVILIK